jgi:hypothetical protein
MTREITRRSLWFTSVLVLACAIHATPASAQVLDADCFAGSCGGSKGVPVCPAGYEEVGLVLYANSKADANGTCETVVSCTNVGRSPVEVECRFHHGFNPLPAGGTAQDALCRAGSAVTPGETSECATDATPDPFFQTGGIFLAGDGDCPVFEGKGLVCVKGGKADDVLCQAHLVCNNGAVLEKIDVVGRKPPLGRLRPQ